MCAYKCIYIYTQIHTCTYLCKIYLYKGNINSKMLRNGGFTESQKTKEKESVKAVFDIGIPCC